MGFTRVTAKLHTMRKEQSFSVQPMTNGEICVQSGKSIGTYNPETGDGRLSTKGNTFVHLAAYSVAYTFPEAFRTEVASVLAGQGPETDLGGIIVKNTITVIE